MVMPLTGRLTLLFTDIEGSTRLLLERGEDYPGLLTDHRMIVRSGLAQHRGLEIDTQGDAFFAVFSEPSDAIAAAEAIQGKLADGPVRVRMGIHTGTPLWTGEGYVGSDVHVAARICSAAHGGQVLIGEATRQFVPDAKATDLGRFRLKDIADPVQIYQLGDVAFPPLRTMHATNLPVQPNDLIGRDTARAELMNLLANGGPRLITLVGPGGIGKTSLALTVAAAQIPGTPAGVFFVDLTRVRDPRLVGLAISQTIGAAGDLAIHIGDRAMLLVLDNMEHVIQAAADVAQLLATCPNLRLLVTSRIALRVRGEHLYPVGPLPEAASVALFVQRAQVVDPSVTTDPAVIEICRRLDGLPLAIELAASRLGVLSPAELLKRLEQRLALLTGGSPDLPDRQQTLRATVAWSVDLLAPGPRALFVRLAVFVGGWTLDAAEAICAATVEDLGALVDLSLVQRMANRYGMLETIREFATDELAEIPGAEALREQHARFYAEYCRDALVSRGFVDEIGGFIDDDDFLAFARADSPNIGLALEWLEAHQAGDELLVMVQALWFYWLGTGATELGEHFIQAALDCSNAAGSAKRAWVVGLLGEFPRFSGDNRRAIKIKVEALDMARQFDDQGSVSAFLADLTSLHATVGEFDTARTYGEEALDLRRTGAAQIGIQGGRGVAHALHALAELSLRSGDPVEAERLVREADALEAAAVAPPRDRLWTAFVLEETVRSQGRGDEARVMAADILVRAIDLEYPMIILESVVALAEIRSRNDPVVGATLVGAADAMLTRVRLVPFNPDEYARTAARLRTTLGDDAYDRATSRGRLLAESDLISLA